MRMVEGRSASVLAQLLLPAHLFDLQVSRAASPIQHPPLSGSYPSLRWHRINELRYRGLLFLGDKVRDVVQPLRTEHARSCEEAKSWNCMNRIATCGDFIHQQVQTCSTSTWTMPGATL